ncbi:leucine-rich repeat neuronal protein 1 isoform X2 [Nerophis ophidion]|uniref:leucine-rich repeat neuronal protein 1 isoform X2 n=1 Tax=Nerophis ophidion TaxID=159077 RepID=UPI002ADFB241|nr:leucine-rich repeat neuronal protein 1 isoform X2 [Nerophis ophidion]
MTQYHAGKKMMGHSPQQENLEHDVMQPSSHWSAARWHVTLRGPDGGLWGSAGARVKNGGSRSAFIRTPEPSLCRWTLLRVSDRCGRERGRKCIMGRVLFVLGAFLLTSSLPPGGAVECPVQCVCETRPWYTPQSVFQQAVTVDCNELHFNDIPGNISSDTQVLLLQSNNISSVSRELERLTNLTELDLSENQLTQVRGVGAWSLVTLYLEENRIEELDDESLKNLSRLEELYLNHNRISSITPGAFVGVANLLRLHLNANRLVAVDSRWFQSLPSLEILMLGDNPILGLEDNNFLPLSRLHSLVLAGMGLTSVPAAAFVGLDYLESLSLCDNRLRSVPQDALNLLPNLKFLDLNRNPMERLQRGDFKDLQHLEELSVNNMDALVLVEAETFRNLPGLVKVDLSNNAILSHLHARAFRGVSSLRTLLLHNSRLRLLSGDLLEALPSLEELSLYSDPLRCDCLSGWARHLGNESHVRLLESSSTRCSSPPGLIGRELREVAANVGGGADACLPLIDVDSFVSELNANVGETVTLKCSADADPSPQFYWVTPTGDKVRPEAAPITSKEGRALTPDRKYQVTHLGTLVMQHVAPSDAGAYTCVAWNVAGADTKSATVSVDAPGSPRLHWRGRGEEGGSRALLVTAKVVSARSMVLAWAFHPRGGGASNPQDTPLPLPRWSSAAVHINNAHISYTAKVPVDVQEYNLTHLLPASDYHVCLTIVAAPSSLGHTSCLNVTTKGAGFTVAPAPMPSRRSGVALAAATGAIFAVSIMALLVFYMGRRRRASFAPSLKKYMQHAAAAAIPLHEYPPLITLWEGDKDKEGGAPAGSHIDTTKTYTW